MRHKLGVPLPLQLLDAALAYPTTTYLCIIILILKLYYYRLYFQIINLFGINTVAVYIPNGWVSYKCITHSFATIKFIYRSTRMCDTEF